MPLITTEQNPAVPTPSPTLRRASNSFKHGLYATKLTYNTPGDHQFYTDILHDYVQHYRPITPDEETLVQQLAALQFRHLKVQHFQADAMRSEVLAQCKNAALEPDGSLPTELAIETRAFAALCENPAFQLYMRELNRLPNKIQRTIDRIHLLIRLRPEVAAWSVNQPSHLSIAPAEASHPQPEPLNIQASEETAQAQGTNPAVPGITTKEDLIDFWNNFADENTRQILAHGPFDWPPRLAFFDDNNLSEKQFWAWLKEAWKEGKVKLPARQLPDAA